TPSWTEWSAAATFLVTASIRAIVISAAARVLADGVLKTTTPLRVAASTSMLSTPTPARATTRSESAPSSREASTLVALRTISPRRPARPPGPACPRPPRPRTRGPPREPRERRRRRRRRPPPGTTSDDFPYHGEEGVDLFERVVAHVPDPERPVAHLAVARPDHPPALGHRPDHASRLRVDHAGHG